MFLLTLTRDPVDVFSIAAHVFINLFIKIWPLFGQILITCLKCSRDSFSISSFSEKMHWGRKWNGEGGAPGCTWVDGGTYLIYRRCQWEGGQPIIQWSFHVKWTKAGHDPSQILMKLFQMNEIRLSWKFNHKLITHSKVLSWHHKLKINKRRSFTQLRCIFESQ